MKKCVLGPSHINTIEFAVGDSVILPIEKIGCCSATVHKVTYGEILFIFDECVAVRNMNEDYSNQGGYEASDLHKWMNEVLLPSFEPGIRDQIKEITIPTYGMIFGHDALYEAIVEPDRDEQLPLMKEKEYQRVFYRDGELGSYWLRNASKQSWSRAGFAYANVSKFRGYVSSSQSYLGVRPAILIK